MNIFDSHTHINSKEFANDLPDVVWRARALDVNMMLVLARLPHSILVDQDELSQPAY